MDIIEKWSRILDDLKETPEEKELSEYLKSIGIKSLCLISEKSLTPHLLIKFENETEEYHSLSKELIDETKKSDKFDWKSLLDKIKNNKQ